MASMFDIPADPKKIRARIRDYERKFQRELEEHGNGYGDGAGKRYFLGPLYMLVGDLDGALKSFRWFDETYPEDSGEPGHCLCWTLALRRADNNDAAMRKLRQTMLMNLYLIPRLLGREVRKLDIWEGSSDGWPSYVDEIPPAFYALWTYAEKAWAAGLYDWAEFTEVRERYVLIHRCLKDMSPSGERKRLCEESFEMVYGKKPRDFKLS